MSNVTVQCSNLSGSIIPPSAKSHSIRALLFASLASGKSEISQVLLSPDIIAMHAACVSLGAAIIKNGQTYTVHGCNGEPNFKKKFIDVGNSGQVLRFMAAMCALQDQEITLVGDPSASQRPMQDLINGLSQLGGKCQSIKNNGCAPLTIQGPLTKDTSLLEGQDSQPVSALLMMAPFSQKDMTTIKVLFPGEKPWIDLTCDWLTKMNINYDRDNYSEFKVQGRKKIIGFNYQVPADFSSMAFSLVAALVTNSYIEINNLDFNDIQGDKEIISICQKMGAKLETSDRTLKVFPSKLTGSTIDLNNCIDSVPILAVLATKCIGETRLINIKVARQKECDRLHVITKELEKMGANIQEHDDELVIQPSELTANNVNSHFDHRIAMALIVAGMISKGKTMVENTDCINKSYPSFVKDMQQLGSKINIV